MLRTAKTGCIAFALVLGAAGSSAAAISSASSGLRTTLPPLSAMTVIQKNAVLAPAKLHVRSADSGVVTFSPAKLGDPNRWQFLYADHIAVAGPAGFQVDSTSRDGAVVLAYAPAAAARHHLVVFTLASAGGSVHIADASTHTALDQTVHGSSAQVALILPPALKLDDVRRYDIRLTPKTGASYFIVRQVTIQDVE